MPCLLWWCREEPSRRAVERRRHLVRAEATSKDRLPGAGAQPALLRDDREMSERDPVRLFLALWPEPALRARLAAYRDEWHWPAGAKPVADATLHLTLHFIGALALDRVPGLAASLAAVAAPDTVLRPAAAEVWKGGIAVLRIDADAALAELHERLGSVLASAGIPVDARPFAPHVTLARKAARAEPPSEPAAFQWHANSFVLAESIARASAPYEVLSRFGAAAQALSDDDSG
jgi:2'-5' RNA ligase